MSTFYNYNSKKTSLPLGIEDESEEITAESIFVKQIDYQLFKWMKGRIHPYRWAIKHPEKGASAERIIARLAGKKPMDGGAKKFNPFHITNCRENGKRFYVTSSSDLKGVLWIDVDVHSRFLTMEDAKQAIQIIEAEFCRIFRWSHVGFRMWAYESSIQGCHILIPVSYGSYPPAEVGGVYTLLAKGLQQLLYYYSSPVATTTETKGHPPYVKQDGTLYCGTLCRIPLEHVWWGNETVLRIRVMSDTPISQIAFIAELLCATYPPIPLPHQELVPVPLAMRQPSSTLSDLLSSKDGLPEHSEQPVTITAPDEDRTPYVADLQNEPDSRKRQHDALMRYARTLHRVPKFDEAMNFIFREGLFTDEWEKNLEKRVKRVKGILRYISKNFDPNKTKGKAQQLQVEQSLSHMRQFTELHFPDGTTYLPQTPNNCGAVISPERIAVFLTIANFCLIIDPNKDGTGVPRE